MFSAAEMQLIRTHCPADYEALLKKLSIPIPSWAGDEFRIYRDVDGKLEKKLCDLMKCTSIIDGYNKLLKIGGISQDGSESYNRLLGMIVANSDKILRGLENIPKFIEVEVPTEPQPQQPPPRPARPKTKTVTQEEHITLKGPIILGGVLIVLGLILMFMLGIGGIILAVLGAASLAAGVRGKIKRTTKEVPDKEKIPVPQPTTQAVSRIVRKEVKPPFTRNELQKILDVLAQVDKIVRAI